MKGLQIESEQLRFGIIGAMERKLLCQITVGTDKKWVAEDKTNHLMWGLLELRVRLD